MNNIKLIKLSTGEEVLTEIVTSDLEGYQIKNAVTLIYQPSPDGKMTAGFAPFMPYSKGDITVASSSLIAEANVDDQMLYEYKRIFSNIVVAQPGSF